MDIALDSSTGRALRRLSRAASPAELRARDEAAVARLHGILLRAAQVRSRPPTAALPHVRGNELDDIALEAADDALISVLARLDDFRGASRFTKWAYKFALPIGGRKARSAAPGRAARSPSSPRAVALRERRLDAGGGGAQKELLAAVQDGIATALTPHQRTVRRSRAERRPDRRPGRSARGARAAPLY